MPLTIPRRLGLSSRVARVAAQAAVVTVVVGGTVAYAHADKTVTLNVDGKTAKVSAFADTVGELLEEEGIETGPRDLVAPAATAELDEGDTVVVRYARLLTVKLDGKERTFWTTESTVDGALSALGLRADDARLSVSRSSPIGRQGLTMSLTTPKSVTIRADGATKTVTTTSATVGDLLTELGITLGPRDDVNLVPASAVTEGLAVAVTRVTSKQVTVAEAIAFGTKKVSTSSLYKGQTKVVTAGVKGSRAATYELTLVDGKETARKLLKATVTKQPVTQVVQVGTKAKPRATSSFSGGSVPGASGLNWAALAACESGGNPRAVNPAGYYGLYQFSLSTWRSVGGSGNPIDASSSEQTYRAQVLYGRTGASSWPHCGPRLFS